MTESERKNSCTRNQDQMFNAVQWAHINSFMLCRVPCARTPHLDGVAVPPCFFLVRMQCAAIAQPPFTSTKFKSRQHYVASTLFVFCFAFWCAVWMVQHRPWGEKVSLKKSKQRAKILFITRKQRTTISFAHTNDYDAKFHKTNRTSKNRTNATAVTYLLLGLRETTVILYVQIVRLVFCVMCMHPKHERLYGREFWSWVR